MFGKRSDAKLVRGESMMREFMPFISPRRKTAARFGENSSSEGELSSAGAVRSSP
jgi:hypothetical protein